MSDNVRYLIPPGMRRCYVTGELRKDTPEENVRQRWARSLVEEYGYPKSDLGIEFSIRMGRAPKRVDLVIFRHGAEHVQKEIVIAIECKRDDKEPSARKDGEDQLFSYMAACPACRFGLWVGRERRAFIREADGKIEGVSDIPRFGLAEPEAPTHDKLVPANELTSVLRRCHNYITQVAPYRVPANLK